MASPLGYRKLKNYWEARFGGRVQKVSLHAGLTCPNRDGTIGVGGCYYCSNEAFTPGYCHSGDTIEEQIKQGVEFQSRRYPRAVGFLGYLQAYTNTHGPMDELVRIYESVLENPLLIGMVIGTRPDCLPQALLDWLSEASKQKPVYIELGIESFSDEILNRMNRGHSFTQAAKAVERVVACGLPVGGHFLVGFPGEPWKQFFDSVELLNKLPLHSVKVHQLHVFRNTPLAEWYEKEPEAFLFPSREDYFNKAADWLAGLRPDLYVDRVFGDVPLKYVLNPSWGVRLDQLVREFDAFLSAKNIFQGCRYE
ncbi:TIGR01212 family radical SAM protein [Puniceicoccales bacterium CK1056]|uniref:TIGR01212 family radical SAM protein n=1 Tax=Oceanipulchritudo coccoides TaxID=2706888 RepID=A0A6B2M0R3_9BACT|nr:TIGR01212 family radical SAM protein [Oceanipulchritudo coccoides]